MNEEELKNRTKKLALAIIKFVDEFPRTPAGNAVSNQLVRSGTSVGSNYRAACRSRSKVEFIARLGIVEEEADESAYWLEIIIEASMLKKEKVLPLLNEGNELAKIMRSSRISASSRS